MSRGKPNPHGGCSAGSVVELLAAFEHLDDRPHAPRLASQEFFADARRDSVGGMRYGVTMFMTDQTMAPVELARAVEERGLYSLYVPEHTHIPTSRLDAAADR